MPPVHISIVSNKRKWICREIPRCGCMTLKYLAYKDCVGYEYNDKANIHLRLGHQETDIINRHNYIQDGYIVFAVVRDPVERSISTWRSFTQGHSNRFKNNGIDFDGWVDYVGECLLEETQDVHIRPQSNFFIPEEMDYVVKLEDLSNFLGVYFGYEDIDIKATSKVVQTEHIVTDSGRQKLAQLYKMDYELLKTVNWVGETK